MRPHALALLLLAALALAALPNIDPAALKAAAQTAKSCQKLARLTALELLAANETALAAIEAAGPGDAAKLRADAARRAPELAALRAQAGGSLPQTCDTLKAEAACAAVRALRAANGKLEGAVGNATAGVVVGAVAGMVGADMQALVNTCEGDAGIVRAQALNGIGADGAKAPVPAQAWILSHLVVAFVGAMML